MKKICTLLAVTTLCVVSVRAQSVSDNFNDSSRDTELWWEPYVDGGNGQLLEQNERVEFVVLSGGETDASQSVKRYPNYNQAWQVQMVVSMDKNNFSALGEVGSVSIDIGTGENHWLGMGYGAGVLSAGPSLTAITAGWSVGAGEDNNITAIELPSAIGIRIAYDPQRRLIRAYYDLDADQTDGEWTLYDSFTIGDSPNPVGHVLNWGMTEFDNFYIAIDGYSSGATIAAGSAWADDFEYTQGQTLFTPTFADDFSDNARDGSNWQAPSAGDLGGEALNEINERLEFTTSGNGDHWITQGLNHSPTYDEPWQVEALIAVSGAGYDSGELGYMGIAIGGGSNGNIDIGRAAGIHPLLPTGAGIFTQGEDAGGEPDEPQGIFDDVARTTAIGVRMTYDPNTRIVRSYYDLNDDNTDGEWTFLHYFTINDTDIPTADAAIGTRLDFAMTQFDTFEIRVYGGAEGNVTVQTGAAFMDDFEFNKGTTATSSSLAFSDDFNDDSVAAAWFVDQPDGDAEFFEKNHRTEFTSPSGSGESQIDQLIGGQFYPQYNQAFDVRFEAHALPADPMTTFGQVAVMELRIANDSGPEEVLVSVGAANLTGSKEQVYAVSNSEVEFVPGEIANVFEAGALPDVVGVKASWNPDAQQMTVYLDTDDDRSVETWVQVIQYALDDAETGWGMSPTDLFNIAITGYADGTVVNSGDAYVDNFSIIKAEPPVALAGYELWAQDIPNEGMRGQTDDASGNGIPNLLQYMYGLAPLATDTDVKLRIEMNGGVPELIHGFNTTATDYTIDYMEKLDLTAGWSGGLNPNSVATFEANGKTFRRVTLPAAVGNKFLQLEIFLQ